MIFMFLLSKRTFLPARRATVPRLTVSVIAAALRKLPGEGSPPHPTGSGHNRPLDRSGQIRRRDLNAKKLAEDLTTPVFLEGKM